MTKLRKKLLLSILTLALTFIALGSTTFAWFTLGTTNTANAFNATVETGQGLEISLGTNKTDTDMSNWAWSQTVDLSTSPYTPNQTKFVDLTSTNGINFSALSGSTVTPSANGNYVSIPVYFRTTATTGSIQLNSIISADSKNVNWNPDASFTWDNITFAPGDNASTEKHKIFNALNACRVSFVATPKEGTSTAMIVEPTYTAVQTDISNTAAKNFDDYDDTTAGLAYAYAKAKSFTVPENTTTAGTQTTTTAPLTNGAYTFNSLNIVTLGDANKYATISTGTGDNTVTYYVYKVVINVWMEGWDGDCINAILAQKIAMGFTFKLV